MDVDNNDGPSDNEKVEIASNFILHAPPGEFNEVFNDVRTLVNNDSLLEKGCTKVFSQYCKEQFTPVKIEQNDKQTLISPFNDLGRSRFYDPRSNKTFKFDYLRRESSDIQQNTQIVDQKMENFRSNIENAVETYVQNHFKTGTLAVFAVAEPMTVHICIEAHQFQPKNFHNGRWRSQWSLHFQGEKSVDMKGLIRVQVHYFEDGNVQLVSSKEVNRKIATYSSESSLGREVAKIIEQEESNYQTAVCENYATMSGTTFKALRRPLPVTHTKMDWAKIATYKIGAELKPQ